MAHRRALPPRRPWGTWLLVPLALALDAVAAARLAGHPLPHGVTAPQGVLVLAPIVVYGGLALFALSTRPLASRLAVAAGLLGLHAGLVALHTIAYTMAWSYSLRAALRLAHRGSPLVPLLQLLWVPLLAMPFLTSTESRRRPVKPQRAPTRVSIEVLLARASRVRGQSDQVDVVEPSVLLPTPVALPSPALETTPNPDAGRGAPDEVALLVQETRPFADVDALAPHAAPSDKTATIVSPPTWFDQLLEPPAHDIPLPLSDPEPLLTVPDSGDSAAAPAPAPVIESPQPEAFPTPEPVAFEGLLASPTPMPVVTQAPASGESLPWEDLEGLAQSVAAVAAAPPEAPVVAPSHVAASPIDLALVARVFAPYGRLLSRQGKVRVEWMPDSDASIVWVAPEDVSAERLLRLAARLASALGRGATPGPIERLSLQTFDGVLVLTPLDGAVLATACRRRGAVALLEILSTRVAPNSGSRDTEPLASAAPADVGATGSVQVETPAARFDVLAPASFPAPMIGEFAGRLLSAIADAGGLETLQGVSVSLGAGRLVIHPVHPAANPARFVAVVGGSEPPGLLGRRAERVARVLRDAS